MGIIQEKYRMTLHPHFVFMIALCSKSCFHFVDEKLRLREVLNLLLGVIGKRWSRSLNQIHLTLKLVLRPLGKFVNGV